MAIQRVTRTDNLIAIIGFGNGESPLGPLWPSTHRALIPVAGKPTIVYLIEQLADAGIRHVRIAGSIQQFAVRKRLRCGREWGVKIRYSDLRKDELLNECLITNGNALLLYGDRLYDSDFSEALREFRPAPYNNDTAALQPGYWHLENGGLHRSPISQQDGYITYENTVATPEQYLHVNVRAASRISNVMNIPGASLHSSATVDWNSDIGAGARIGDQVFIGKHCRVGQLARLEANCVLSNGVVVADGACLKNVVVLPNCYVGRKMQIRDAILGCDGVLSLSGNFWPVENDAFLGRTRRNAEAVTGLPDAMEDLHYRTLGAIE